MQAKELYEECMALCRELSDDTYLTNNLISLGYVLLLEGDHERAEALNEEAATLLRERGHRYGLPYALDNLGWPALLKGNHVRARELHKESLRLARELGNRLIAAESLDGLACAAGAKGEAGRATRLFGAPQALRAAVAAQHTPRERALREPHLTAARSRLDQATWEAAFEEGQAMSLEEAVEYALSEQIPVTLASPAPDQPSAI